ncbi:hypothetical protein A6R68_18545 [Neotoma lepida]|uniref:Uncharacterized protein n=1 Tax=Neotoma lepida TaxID=56216 RepID=A0A1A6HLB9_NEOLE|nr:hypothetical protein A6R68_18545 [Neotoma lepida]
MHFVLKRPRSRIEGPVLPFLDEHDEELVTKVEEPSTFLGAREATTAKRGSWDVVCFGPHHVHTGRDNLHRRPSCGCLNWTRTRK